MDTTLYILTGYTAVGKTRLSIDWAKQRDAEIVSCDSLLFYRNMDIGTAKPSRDEMVEVPHHMIDIVDSSNQYSINEYLKRASEVVSDIHSRGKKVLVVGGSGFYLSGFFGPVVDDYVIDTRRRVDIERRFEAQPLEQSVGVLQALNPEGLGDLDTRNPRRVLKAWLRCVASGKSLLKMKSEFEAKPGVFDSYDRRLQILTRPREELEERVKLRVDLMLSQGLEDEVVQLLEQGILDNPSAARAIGYRETIACLDGKIPREELAETISMNTRKLLKKQRTWFKKYLPTEAVRDISELNQLTDDWYFNPASQPNVTDE